MMVETLYKTNTPEASVWDAECYELVVETRPGTGADRYGVKEIHGWWDDSRKKFVHSTVTLNPEEGFATFEEAKARYIEQRDHRAQSGFVHSFTPQPWEHKPYHYRLLTER